jgi:NAD(P)-dependent dehydrogenase (short-subunit alcohol dehydrogenase family)
MGVHDGRGVFVSGGTTGMGLAAARRFVADGAKVFVVGRTPAKLEAALAELGPAAAGCPCDVAVEAEVEAALDRALPFLGRLDAVFVNAGVDGQNRGCLEIDVDFFRYVMGVNCVGSFLVARGAARRMPDGGALVFNASISGLAAEEGFADYSASKGGQVLLARTMAKELGRRGFWVPIVCPGYVRTPQVDKYLDDPEIAADILRQIPLGRVGTADEIADLVSFLARPEAAYLNGAIVNVDGGRMA